jgi:hypothetical protein
MGYWGYYVVGRAGRPLDRFDALTGVKGAITPYASASDGWQVWEYPSRDGEVGNMNDLAEQTGAPALFGYVIDSACVVLDAAGPDSGAWTTCLARTATADYLGADELGLALEDYFLQPRDAADRAVAWAAEAGHPADADALLDVLAADPGPENAQAEQLFFRLLDRLGVLPL